jgi:hypothetical protein
MAFLSARPLATLASQSNEDVQQMNQEGTEREEAGTESEEAGTEREEEDVEKEQGDAPTWDVMQAVGAGTIEAVAGTIEEVAMRKHLSAICDGSHLVYSLSSVAKLAASLVLSLMSQLPPDKRKGALRSVIILLYTHSTS